MDATSLETVSRWAGAAAVILSLLAAIAISIAAYASSRLVTGTPVRTEVAPTHEQQSEDQQVVPEPVQPTLVTPTVATAVTRSSEPPRDRHAAVAMLQAAVSPPEVELTWVADPDSYVRAREIERALTEAGWTVTPAGSVLLTPEPAATSLTAGALSDETLLLRRALESVGVKLTILFEPAMPADRVRLMIGNDQ